MKQKLKRSKGITLISLVVTIIVLIILAGISLSLVLGENGVIEKAKETKPIVDVASAQEKLELVKGSVLLEKYSVNLDDYLEELDKVREKYEVNDVKRIDNDNAEIIIGGKYKFIATDEKNGNVKITYQGEVGKTVGLEISPTSGTYVYPTTGTFKVIKNISGGELSVKSENENIAKATISGTTVTVEPQNVAGTVKIIVTSAANGEYAEQKAVYKATVENGTITLSVDAYTGNYDGNDHDAVSNVKVTPTDATVEYSIDGGTFSSTIPKVNGANTYSVSIRASKAGYATKTITKTVTIGKNTQIGNLVLSASSGIITYPTAGTFTVTKNASGGALSVTSSDTSVATVAISGTTVTITPKAISADGKQTTITVTSAATSNYEKQTQTYTATVNRGTISLDATAYTGNYDGSDHNAVSNVKVTPTDATVEYSLNGGTFSTSIPKVNGANTYSVSIRASKAGYATKTITKTVTINLTTYSLKAGVYINYNTGVSSVGTNGIVTCRVLYDASSQYGLQIVTDKNISNVTLGGSDWATTSASYNNAIATLNNEAGKYLNRAYATDARCVGSVPTNQNGTFTSKNSENAGPVKLQFTSSVSGANNMKGADTNYTTDQTQMKSLNIWKTGENYWLASRDVSSNSSLCGFIGRLVNTDGSLGSSFLCFVHSSGNPKGGSNALGLRPCFSLKSDIKITGGNGTSDSPYTM